MTDLSKPSNISHLTEQKHFSEDDNTADRRAKPESSLHRQFEVQVQQTPDVVAVVDLEQERQLSYANLNAHANRLAHWLRLQGVGPDVQVGICLHRSLELVISVLAVLKAGGAYVPLDPSYPSERLAYILRDAQITLLLSTQAIAEKIPPYAGTSVLVDEGQPIWHRESVEDLQVPMHPLQLAYVIYTSGSTGRPKGTMNTHEGICNRITWGQQRYPLTSDDHLLMEASFSFDVSVWELFWPLVSGAMLVLVPQGDQYDPRTLITLTEQYHISILHFSPSMLRLILEEIDSEQVRALKHIFCGGEVLVPDLQVACWQRLPTVQLHNQYGPTETAAHTTYWDCLPEEWQRSVPIGKPISNMQVYVLDTYLQPVPSGVVGELFIAGVGIGRGYVHQPAQTAEKFLPHPFSKQAGERLYRTGDLGRRRGDGMLEFVGRVDQQIKLRGFRIELGEVENVLNEQPGVKESIVLVRIDKQGEPRLQAYVLAEMKGIQMELVRQGMQRQVPAYMIPATFQVLEVWPLNPNGKVDRGALPDPQDERPLFLKEYVAARSPLEAHLVQIWQNALGLEQVGIQDNFFELGGHSLLATQVIIHIREVLKIDMPLFHIFEQPTIVDLAYIIEQEQMKNKDVETFIEMLEQLSDEEVTQILDQENKRTCRINTIN